MSNDHESHMVAEQAVSAVTLLSSPATAPTPSSELQSNHKRSSLLKPKDTENTVTPLAIPSRSHHNMQYQPSKPSSPPPLRPIRPLDPDLVARMKAFSLSRTGQRKHGTSIPRDSASPTRLGLVGGKLGLHLRPKEEVAVLKDELDEPELKGIATAGLTNDQWRATKGLLVVKGDVGKPTAK